MNSDTNTATRFLSALFDIGDTLTVRPVETWTEDGRKRSRVDYHRIFCATFRLKTETPGPGCSLKDIHQTTGNIIARSEDQQSNVFFGVAPRFGRRGEFEQAWQIRKVNCLWSDVDDTTPKEALERCSKAGLPAPSVVVNSGNGGHLYWLLDAPYLIDDTEDPQPVFTEFVDRGPDQKKSARRYYLDSESGDRLYLDAPQNVPPLSPKALHVQDVLAGVASAIAGDQTFDLARLLRLPGTMNRKDQRNGREPIPCELVELHPDRKYSFADFAKFASESPTRKHRDKLAKVELPTPRKPSATKLDKLAELLLACGTADPGDRSERDFALCCYAVEKGISRQDVWSQVQGVGKFAEGGDRYFTRTWQAA